MADKLSPEIKEFIGELYEADYTANQIKTILGEFDITVSTTGIRYQRPEIKARQKEYQQRPEVKARQKEYQQRPEIKARQKEYRQGPEFRAKQKEYRQRPEIKARQKEYAQRPEFRAKQKEYRQRPEIKERLKEYKQRPEIKERLKEYKQRPEIKEKLRKYNREYGKEYFRRPEVKDRWSEYALLRRDVKLDTVLNDLDIYIIDLFYTHPKLSVNEIARYIRNIGEKAGSEFMFTDLEKRITVALELIKENAGEDSPIIYSGDDIYEMNPSSSCWKIYEEGLESTVE